MVVQVVEQLVLQERETLEAIPQLKVRMDTQQVTPLLLVAVVEQV
jgi:hypothetical protein